MVSLKIRCGDEIRRISVERETKFKDILFQLRNLLNVNEDEELILKYLDDEGDKITLSSDLEFREALQCCKEPIQIYVVKCPKGIDLTQSTLENLDVSLSRLLVVEKTKVIPTREEQKRSEEEQLKRNLMKKMEEERERVEEYKRQEAEKQYMLLQAKKMEEEKKAQEERKLEEKRIEERKKEEERMKQEEKRIDEERKKEVERRMQEEKRIKEEERILRVKQIEEEERQRNLREKQIEEERKHQEQRIEEERILREKRMEAEREEERRKQELKKLEEEKKQIQEHAQKMVEVKKQEEIEKERIQRRKLNDNGPKKPSAKKNDGPWSEYKARNGRTVLLDLSMQALDKFGVHCYQRVNTSVGKGTVIGVDQEHGFLWFQLDKDKDGLSYWDDISNYDTMVCKGVIPAEETASVSDLIPIPKSSEALLAGIINADEKEMMLKVIQESLIDQKQMEIKAFYRSVSEGKSL